jgi:hypothetical protein
MEGPILTIGMDIIMGCRNGGAETTADENVHFAIKYWQWSNLLAVLAGAGGDCIVVLTMQHGA